jgi:DNA-3-methyladenine glycosylase
MKSKATKMRIPREFYARNTVEVAKDLLGKTLVRKIGKNTISGIITETEAYRHSDDPASHAFRSMTERNKAMFGEVGHAYVYFTYGMYYCVNAVARSRNFQAGAVLIRALEPRDGIDIMIQNRKTDKISKLTDGPAKLAIALGITKMHYGEDLVNSPQLYITDEYKVSGKTSVDSRVGIRYGTEKLWNFKLRI